jgi:hypothetical protein
MTQVLALWVSYHNKAELILLTTLEWLKNEVVDLVVVELLVEARVTLTKWYTILCRKRVVDIGSLLMTIERVLTLSVCSDNRVSIGNYNARNRGTFCCADSSRHILCCCVGSNAENSK